MKILNSKVYEGRNVYSHKKCVRLDVDLEGYSEIPSKDIENFNERILSFIPELKTHRCGIDEDGGFVKRLEEGTYLAHICEHTILALQNRIGIDVAYGKSREIKGEYYYIVYQYEYKNTAIEISRIAVDLINCLIRGKDFRLDLRVNELREILKAETLGPSTKAIIDEARKRNIPIIRLGDKSMFQLGYGKYGKFIEATIGEKTSTVAVDIACDKLLTKEILDMNCLPVARGGKVQNALDLLLKGESLGYPVVLKPRFGNQGKGVYVNLKDEKELLNAYNTLIKEYDEVIIERNIKGRDYRVCVVNYEVVAVAERIPPYIIGNGFSTVQKLIEELNRDERRGDGHEKPLTKIKIDDKLIHCINKRGYNLNMVVPKAEKVYLRENANLSTGGIAVDCTDEIAQENINICKRAAKAVGLDICGIDICSEDISESLASQGAIIEINAAPGIRMHHYPSQGEARDVSGAIVDMLFSEPYHMPIVSVTGTNGKTTTTRLISHVLSMAGYSVGMTTTGGIYINNECIDKGDTTGPESAMTVLMNRDIDAAVLETARGGIVRRGLAYDLADVAVITNITEDHLGIDGVETIEDLALVKSLVGEAVKPKGYVVLNADDEVSKTIINRMKSKIIFFSKSKENSIIKDNIEKGEVVVYVDEEVMYIQKGTNIIPLINVKDIGITLDGKLEYNIENAMAASATLVGLGVDYNLIKGGLTSFYSSETQNPGRFNVYNLNDCTIVLDYGHNIEGYRAVMKGIKEIKHDRLIGIIGVPGDRLNSNVIEIGRMAAENFDYIYIKEDEDRRGRKPGEIAELLEKGIVSTGFEESNFQIILNERDALRKALQDIKPKDLIIIFFEKYEPLVEIVKSEIRKSSEYSEETVMA